MIDISPYIKMKLSAQKPTEQELKGLEEFVKCEKLKNSKAKLMNYPTASRGVSKRL